MIVTDALVLDTRVVVVERISISTSRSSASAPVNATRGVVRARGAQQMQPQTPKVAGVRGAVAALGPAGQIRALDPRSSEHTRGGSSPPPTDRRRRRRCRRLGRRSATRWYGPVCGV